jgi:hypothetical protein
MKDTLLCLHFYRVPGTAATRLDMSICLVLSGVSGCCIWLTSYVAMTLKPKCKAILP